MAQSFLGWLLHWAQTPWGTWALFLCAFVEAAFFPIPPDILFVTLSVQSQHQSFWFATVCILGSVLGGILGYTIGLFGGRPIALRLFKKEKMDTVEHLYQKFDIWALSIAGYTPLPYQAYTMVAGVLSLNLRRFVVSSTLGRMLRFYPFAALFYFFGATIVSYVQKYMTFFSIGLIALIALGYFALHRYSKSIGKEKRT